MKDYVLNFYIAVLQQFVDRIQVTLLAIGQTPQTAVFLFKCNGSYDLRQLSFRDFFHFKTRHDTDLTFSI